MEKLEGVTYTMDYSELDEIVQNIPGKEKFESIAEFEWNNREAHIINNVKETAQDEFHVNNYEDWKQGKASISVTTLIAGLFREKLIEEQDADNIIVEVSW